MTGQGKAGTQPLACRSAHCCLVLACLTSQQHASLSQGPICHTEVEAAEQTCYFTQYTDTRPSSPNASLYRQKPDRLAAGVTIFLVTGVTRPEEIPTEKVGIEPGSTTLEADALTTRPTKQSMEANAFPPCNRCGHVARLRRSLETPPLETTVSLA